MRTARYLRGFPPPETEADPMHYAKIKQHTNIDPATICQPLSSCGRRNDMKPKISADTISIRFLRGKISIATSSLTSLCLDVQITTPTLIQRKHVDVYLRVENTMT